MCDQTEVTYSAGDVVWVKLGPVWWPGQVQEYDTLPEEITHDLRKRPIAVVKFFQEDTYEYVKNLNQIYHYNCRKKEEFIKKGLDMVRSSNTRDVPSNMSMFPNDIVMAEHLTGGDPHILDSETFAPEQKANYSEIFGSTKKLSGKKGKGDILKKDIRRHSHSPIRNGRKSLPNLPATIPRPITHPRFIAKALEGKSDHEIRIRCQISIPKDDEENSDANTKQKYKCHLCDFQSARLNVIVLHNKSHSASFIEAQNIIKAKLKSREKESFTLGLISSSEQTPTTVTSRGRVKSLPKKLLDYTDEPPLKILKEKSYSKHIKEENKESPNQNLSEKTPKKQKNVLETTTVKRPLFGKRKSAKEKAQIAAKIKQENDAMKETLLKDWDDDDVNQEEVELERLKQALESTTTSSIDDEMESPQDESNSMVPEKDKKQPSKNSVPGDKLINEDVKIKVFEFDDSEDSLPVNINFRLKNKQEKFTDDKFKKPRPPKPLNKPKPKLSTVPIPPPPLFNEKKDDDKETADLTEAFNALLEETSVPILPEIPTTSVTTNTPLDQFSDQTSDISSSTDLIGANKCIDDSDLKINSDVTTNDSSLTSDIRMECTSSDNEEVNTSDQVDLNNLEALDMKENQKNMKEVSAVPSAETDSEVISSGDATTTTDDFTVQIVETVCITEELLLREDSATTEITSTCDGTKSFIQEAKETAIHHRDGELAPEKDENKIKIALSESGSDELGTGVNEINITVKDSHPEDCFKNEPMFELNSDIITEYNQAKENINLPVSDSSKDYLESTSKNNFESLPSEHGKQSGPLKSFISDENVIIKPVVSVNSGEVTIDISETEILKEENQESISGKHDVKVKTEPNTLETEHNITVQLLPQEVPQQKHTNLQFIFPVSSEPNASTTHKSSQQVETILVPKLEISDQGKIETQPMSQSLQDMELDINSMPVIIGGEDFIQQDQPKPNLVSIQPKYSESIVISPKVNTVNSPKPERVLMHLGEPSTSKQNVQSIISIPSKGGKSGGRGGRAQKATSKTIKLSASTLKNLGALPKGGNQQVLILQTASNKDSQDQGSLQKTKGPLNLIQHGNKILIVNNPQMSGQNKIKLNPQQQQLLTGGKLAPGTRVFTSKVVATTTPPSSETNKASTSKSTVKPTQKLVISKGGLLTNTTKNVIINSSPSGKLISSLPSTQCMTNSKGQTVVTHNIINAKGSLILPTSTQSVSTTGKTATVITSQSLPSSKGMILTPINTKGGQILAGNQKLRIVSSKAPLSGTKFVVQSPQGKMTTIDSHQKGQQIKLISGLKGQTTGSTILIQTSQGLVAKTISSSTVSGATTKSTNITAMPKTLVTSIPTQAKILVSPSTKQQSSIAKQIKANTVQQAQIVQQPSAAQSSAMVKKITVQKVRQGPNILQKTQRKSTPRGSKAAGNRLITQASTAVSEPLIYTTSSSLTVSQPTLSQGQIPQSSEGLLYLTIDESGNYRQIDSKSLITLEGNATETPQTIYIPASSQPQDVRNVFLAIDNAGMTQLVNIAQPRPSTSLTPPPAQDILAKALANTQVLQQETIIPDVDVSTVLASSVDTNALASTSYVEQTQYPAPSLSHSVQETSLTLTQPIMTPLEVPSNVSPSLNQISSLSSNYITTNLITTKQKNLHPSMPLLTEESLTSQTRGEPVFLLDSSNNIIPFTSGSQTSFQLTLNDNIVTMSSGSGGSVLPQTYQVVSGDLLTSQLIATEGGHTLQKVDKLESVKTSEKVTENMSFNIIQERNQISSDEAHPSQHCGILREALEAPQSFKSEQFLNSVEMTQSENVADSNHMQQMIADEILDNKEEQPCRLIKTSESDDINPEQINEQFGSQDAGNGNGIEIDEEKHSLKRSLGEEHVTSSSDPLDDSKRIRLEER